MNTTRTLLFVAISSLGCEPPAATPPAAPKTPAKAVEWKKVEIGKNVFFEVLPSGQRRVHLPAQVCFREGQLELFLCRKFTKEHEAVVVAEVDGRDVHKALLAAGAKAGSPVKFEPKYESAKGSVVKVFIKYERDGKEVTINAREWIKNARTKKELESDWVFGGSFFFDSGVDPDETAKAEKKAPKQQLYAANSGDLICVSNFGTAMLDLPITSSAAADELQFEAWTERIPPLGTKVTIILEPQPEVPVSDASKKR